MSILHFVTPLISICQITELIYALLTDTLRGAFYIPHCTLGLIMTLQSKTLPSLPLVSIVTVFFTTQM